MKNKSKWRVYVPNEGHWFIDYDGDDPAGARRVYLAWAGRRRMPAGARITKVT